MAESTAMVRYEGLSCYTANLAGYLAAEWSATTLIACSIRLAVRADLPGGQLAFSHHARPLDWLLDGTRLEYAAAATPAAALREISRELNMYGRVIVVTNNPALPWAPSGKAAPHWVLIDGKRGCDWRVSDSFSGLMPAGPQEPFTGWLTREQLSFAMDLPAWSPEQRQRNMLAFGYPVPLPRGRLARAPRAMWLRRVALGGLAAVPPPVLRGQWLTRDADIFPFLAERLADAAVISRCLDDCWAAAGHRAFAYRWRLATRADGPSERQRIALALKQWEQLPRVLRFASEASRRGHSRPSLLQSVFAALLAAETGLPMPGHNAADGGG
jgi:hypothetical protein